MKLLNIFFLKMVVLATLLTVLLSSCTSANSVNSSLSKTDMRLVLLDSGRVTFSDVGMRKATTGIRVGGNVVRKAGQLKKVQIPGHLHIILKDKDDRVKETITAHTRRQNGNSRVWLFSGIIKTTVLTDDFVEVKYHNHSR